MFLHEAGAILRGTALLFTVNSVSSCVFTWSLNTGLNSFETRERKKTHPNQVLHSDAYFSCNFWWTLCRTLFDKKRSIKMNVSFVDYFLLSRCKRGQFFLYLRQCHFFIHFFFMTVSWFSDGIFSCLVKERPPTNRGVYYTSGNSVNFVSWILAYDEPVYRVTEIKKNVFENYSYKSALSFVRLTNFKKC